MDNNTVSNPETEVPKGPDMNDSDYLNDMLMSEKHLGGGSALAMNEASNDTLYNEIGTICRETKDMARELFNLQFQKGWYKLDKADANKITTVIDEYNQKSNEIN
jgi:spore coat protein CotF